jgi:hypothetical protein
LNAPRRFRPFEAHFTSIERNIPFVNHVKYLGVIFTKRIIWRPHIEIIETKAFRTFIGVYSVFKNEPLSAYIKLPLNKALIRSVIIYACPAWELVTDGYLLKLQHTQNNVLRTTGNFARCTPVRNLHRAFNLPYVYVYITKLCRQQAEVIKKS